MARHPNASASRTAFAASPWKKLAIIHFLDSTSPPFTLPIMMSYFCNAALPSEPEGWDVVEVLELENRVTKRWSCPTTTLRNRRCENVVSQGRSIKVKDMINQMATKDVAVIVRDENHELTNLAETMFCSTHNRAVDSAEKIRGVVAFWKNCIKTSMRLQAQPPAVRYMPQAPATAYQPSTASSGLPHRRLNTPSEQPPTIHDAQIRPWPTSLENPQRPRNVPPPTAPPSTYYGATFDGDMLTHLTGEFNRLTLENQSLKQTNQKLLAKNARLIDREKTAATEHRRTRGELKVVGDARSVLSEQVGELYQEINQLREWEDRDLERNTALEDSAQRGSRTRRRRKKKKAAAPIVPKKEEED